MKETRVFVFKPSINHLVFLWTFKKIKTVQLSSGLRNRTWKIRFCVGWAWVIFKYVSRSQSFVFREIEANNLQLAIYFFPTNKIFVQISWDRLQNFSHLRRASIGLSNSFFIKLPKVLNADLKILFFNYLSVCHIIFYPEFFEGFVTVRRHSRVTQ